MLLASQFSFPQKCKDPHNPGIISILGYRKGNTQTGKIVPGEVFMGQARKCTVLFCSYTVSYISTTWLHSPVQPRAQGEEEHSFENRSQSSPGQQHMYVELLHTPVKHYFNTDTYIWILCFFEDPRTDTNCMAFENN